MSENDKDRETMTAEDARRLLKQERDERLRICQAQIQRVLKANGCRLVAVPQIVDGRIVSSVQIVVDGARGVP